MNTNCANVIGVSANDDLILRPKTSRHVAIATRHLLAQRRKAIEARNKLTAEIDSLYAYQLAGWLKQIKAE